MKILICDDDKIILRTLEFQFKREGCEVVKAADGRRAVEILESTDDIDLLISDLYMPYINGMELITLVRETLQRSTPIIIMTVANVSGTIQQALELGANETINKPFEMQELMEKIEKVLW